MLMLDNENDDGYNVYILKQKESAKSFADIYIGKNKQFMVFLKDFTEGNFSLNNNNLYLILIIFPFNQIKIKINIIFFFYINLKKILLSILSQL